MASLAVSSVSSRSLCQSATVQRRPARTSTVLCAAGKQEQKRDNKIAKVAAGLAAIMIAAAPAFADQTDSQQLRAKICATNPTSKICLLNSAKK